MRVMVVDLNNFSHYPTMSVGLIVALLREVGIAWTCSRRSRGACAAIHA
jgi:hypothetical protein